MVKKIISRLPADVLRSTSDEGVKLDEGKVRMDLLPWDALEEVAKVLTFGANKYDDRNWEKGIDYSRLFAAAHRHLAAWHLRRGVDPESGLNHLAHAACDILMLLAFELRGMRQFDDRPELF